MERSNVFQQFECGVIKALISVHTLEEGVDVPEADLAIIVAASKERRQMVQRMGRIMRKKKDSRDARFVIVMYTKHSVLSYPNCSLNSYPNYYPHIYSNYYC